MALRAISGPSTPIPAIDAAPLRVRVEPVDGPPRVQSDVRSAVADPPVVIQFGAQALDLARSALLSTLSPRPSLAPETRDADELESAGPGDDLETMLATALGRDETDAALLGALDSSALRHKPLSPGAFGPESGRFARRAPSESGVFRAVNPTERGPLLASPAATDERDAPFAPVVNRRAPEATFSRAPTSPGRSGVFLAPGARRAPEATFPRAATSGVESTFPRVATSGVESTFPRAATSGVESTFPRAATSGVESTFPRAAISRAESAFPRAAAPGAEPTSLRAASPIESTFPRSATPGVRAPSAEDRREMETLQRAEQELRADERAQRAAAGGHASGAQLRYQLGPDGRRYLVASEVTYDVTPVAGDPAATLRKMEAIRRAAMAGDGSISARTAAAEAEQLAQRARAQLAAERYSEAREL